MDSIDENIYVSAVPAGMDSTTRPASTSTSTASMTDSLHNASTKISTEARDIKSTMATGLHNFTDSFKSHLPTSESIKSHLPTVETHTVRESAEIPVGPYPSSTDSAYEYSLPTHATTTTTSTMETPVMKAETEKHSGGFFDSLKTKIAGAEDTVKGKLYEAEDSLKEKLHNTEAKMDKMIHRNEGAEKTESEKIARLKAFDALPSKMNPTGDLETFQKREHSAEERAQPFEQVRDERHYQKDPKW